MKFTNEHLAIFSEAHIHTTLRALNGVDDNLARKLSARWQEKEFAEPEGINIGAEVAAAMLQEGIAEIVQTLYLHARLRRPSTTFNFSKFDLFTEQTELCEEVVNTLGRYAKKLGEGTLFILSPTMLTVIQSMGGDSFKCFDDTRAFGDGQNRPVGTCHGTPVIIDPYGTDSASIIIAAPGWFRIYPSAKITAEFDESGITAVMSDFYPSVDLTKVIIADVSFENF